MIRQSKMHNAQCITLTNEFAICIDRSGRGISSSMHWLKMSNYILFPQWQWIQYDCLLTSPVYKINSTCLRISPPKHATVYLSFLAVTNGRAYANSAASVVVVVVCLPVRNVLLLVTCYLLLVDVGLRSFISFECPTRCKHRDASW